MNGWHDLLSTEQVDQAVQNSAHKTVVFFKHSTRCSISTMAKKRLESLESSELSKADFGECTYDASHMEISSRDLIQEVS